MKGFIIDSYLCDVFNIKGCKQIFEILFHMPVVGLKDLFIVVLRNITFASSELTYQKEVKN